MKLSLIKLLIEYIKDDFDEFDESKLKYGFVSRMGMDPNTSYTSIIYFYYIIFVIDISTLPSIRGHKWYLMNFH